MKRTALATLAITTALLASAGSAQELSDADLASRFLKQKDAVTQARNGNLGQARSLLSRGVELVTVEDLSPEAATAAASLAPIAPETSNDGVTISSAGDTSTRTERPGTIAQPTDPNRPIVHVSFPQQDQVNIRIKFGFDSAAIDDSQLPDLQKMCRVMHSTPQVNLFRIVGHTDASGSEEYNERLSRLRAEEVARFLVEDCGIKATRLETVGFGERFLSDPADPNADANRRVEFQALG